MFYILVYVRSARVIYLFDSSSSVFLTYSTFQGEKQTLMFSATFPEEIQRLAAKFLHDYIFVTVGIVGGACTDVEQVFYQIEKFKKRNKLIEILNEGSSTW